LSADCYLDYKPGKSFRKPVRKVDDFVGDLEGTAEEGRDIFIQLSNVRLKDFEPIEHELSSYTLEKYCGFTFEERSSLLHIIYMPSAIRESIPGIFWGRLTRIVEQRLGEPWEGRVLFYGRSRVALRGSYGDVYKEADGAYSPKYFRSSCGFFVPKAGIRSWL
jgi:hypothetical protein